MVQDKAGHGDGLNGTKSSYMVEAAEDEPQGCGEIVRSWPKTTFCIVGNEFCERFSYYGMRTVLTVYLLNIIGLNDDEATALFHGFTALAYTSPIAGSILADGYIGKFQTIVWVSLFYAFGQVVLAVTSTQDNSSWVHPSLDYVGLAIIAIGTGGIKPCVAPFGADQFNPSQEKLISMYFSMFYFSINAGSTISTFLTPVLRTIPCLDHDSCFPLAFGVPAVLMVVATGVFLIGSFWYIKNPPKDNVIVRVVKAIFVAIKNKMSAHEKRDHWMDHYCDTNPGLESKQLADDIKAVLRIFVMYIPVPVFWALFDQQGSRWIIQSVAMDGKIFEGFELLPDQMQTLNAILIMVFIPIFQGIIYPLFRRLHLEPTPLRKMAAGGFTAAVAFFICAFLQLKINDTLPQKPASGMAKIQFVNTLDCDFTFTSSNDKNYIFNTTMKSGTELGMDVPANGKDQQFTVIKSSGCSSTLPNIITLSNLSDATINIVPITSLTNAMPMVVSFENDKFEKPTKGTGESAFKFIYMRNDDPKQWNGTTVMFCQRDIDNWDANHPCDPKRPQNFASFNVKSENSKFVVIRSGQWEIYQLRANETVKNGDTTNNRDAINPIKIANNNFTFEGQGAIYSLVLTESGIVKSVLASRNSVSILWQVPQYVVITAGEILFSITGLDFSYSQAPPSMKAVIQAAWLFTVAIGDIIILLIAELALFQNLAYEMFFFGGLMVGVMLIFSALAAFYYKYATYTGKTLEAHQNDALTLEDEKRF